MKPRPRQIFQGGINYLAVASVLTACTPSSQLMQLKCLTYHDVSGKAGFTMQILGTSNYSCGSGPRTRAMMKASSAEQLSGCTAFGCNYKTAVKRKKKSIVSGSQWLICYSQNQECNIRCLKWASNCFPSVYCFNTTPSICRRCHFFQASLQVTLIQVQPFHQGAVAVIQGAPRRKAEG